jgi:hypothetical protein
VTPWTSTAARTSATAGATAETQTATLAGTLAKAQMPARAVTPTIAGTPTTYSFSRKNHKKSLKGRKLNLKDKKSI